MRSFLSLLAMLLVLRAVPVLSQAATANSAPPPTLNVDARLVSLPVVVRDKKGALVNNLTKDDFVLAVDGAPQPIRYFDHDADLPLTLGLLVDTSRSQRSVLDAERTASAAFLDDMLKGKGDRGFVIQFAHSTELLADVTDSRAKLQEGLKEIDTQPRDDDADAGDNGKSQGGDQDSRGSGRAHRGGAGTVLYDATFLAADELMAKQKGRKALILLTDGDDRGSRETIAKSIEAAQRADTTIYAIYYKGSHDYDAGNNNPYGRRGGGGGGGFPFPGSPGARGGQGSPGGGGGQRDTVDGKKILERMTGETGGRVFEVKGKEDVASIYRQIGEELRAQYRLGCTPEAAHSTDGYHQVDVTLRDPKNKDRVQTRDGYYSGKP